MHKAISNHYEMKQGNSKPNKKCLERFKANRTAVELTKGDHIFFSPALNGNENTDFEPTKIEEDEDRNHAILLLKSAGNITFGNLAVKLKKSSFLERDKYPTTVSSMFEFLVK